VRRENLHISNGNFRPVRIRHNHSTRGDEACWLVRRSDPRRVVVRSSGVSLGDS
jgi:hypothetical protein